MNARELVQALTQQGVQLWEDEGRLRFRAPEGVLTEAYRHMLAQQKAEILTLLREQDEQEYPLSYAQQSIWFLGQLAPENTAYHIAYAGRVYTALDMTALRQSFETLFERHPMLRTIYRSNNGEVIQMVRRHCTIPLEEIDATAWSEDELAQQMRGFYERPFHLEQDGPMRIAVYRQTPQKYTLLLVLNHIAADGWSLWLLLDELRTLYTAYHRRGRARLVQQQASYLDFIRWQTGLLKSATGEVLRRYWEKQLAGAPMTLELPTDHPRPSEQTHHGASQRLVLAQPRLLMQLAKAQGSTPSTLLLSAFMTLLYRYTGQEDLLIGMPVLGRSEAEFTNIVGDFVNMLVIRARPQGDMSFTTFLKQVRQTMLDALAHQDFPFPLLVERLQPVRDPGRSPLFQVAYAYQKPQQGRDAVLTPRPAQGAPTDDDHLALDPLYVPQQEGQFDLTLEILETEQDLSATLKYNTDLYEAETIKRMLQHFQNILSSIVAEPERMLSRLTLLTEQERQMLLAQPQERQLLDERCLHQLFEAQARRTPSSLAVLSAEQTVSYRELDQRANQLAHYLQHRGVRPDVVVGIVVERSVDLLVGLLGILKAGGAYLPIDPAYPDERQAYMLDDAQVPIVLTQERFLSKAFGSRARVICLDKDWPTIACESQEPPVSEVKNDDLAYIIYTSGSTGKPKGVAVTHASVVNLINWYCQSYAVTPESRCSQMMSVSFDASVREIWPPLVAGARLYLASEEARFSAELLQDWLLEHDITIARVPAPLVKELLMLPWPERTALRFLQTGGEQLYHYAPPGLPFQLINHYGPTECTVIATSAFVPVEAGQERPPSIGRPIANTEVYILDRYRQLVPPGVPGELYIGGAGVARGYLGQSVLTQERFLPHPFRPDDQARVYKTGDIVRSLPDGSLEYLGRIDQQVKVRGFRIEPGEIEAVLASHPAVREGAVIAAGSEQEKRLIAYLVPNADSHDQLIGVVRAFLQEKLPHYMIPSAFVILDVLPLTPNGKLNRQALPIPDMSASHAASGYVKPQNDMEQKIAEIWQHVLQREEIGIYDNFFEIGGDSLLTGRVYSKLRDLVKTPLSVVDLFRYPTINALSNYLNEKPEATSSQDQGQDQGEKLREGQNRLRQRLQKQRGARNIHE